MYAPHSRMSELDYTIEPEVECPDSDPNDAAFVRATTTIGCHDVVEEYVACKIYPFAANFGFESVPLGITPVLKVETPVPLFVVGTITVNHADHFLMEVETEPERMLGSSRPREYDALRVANIPNAGRLNHILEQMGVPYFPHPSLAPQPHSRPTRSRWSRRQRNQLLKRQRLDRDGPLPPEWCRLRLKQCQLRN
jgi:hypothetical protein